MKIQLKALNYNKLRNNSLNYGLFTLPDTETDTDKLCTEPMKICMGLV